MKHSFGLFARCVCGLQLTQREIEVPGAAAAIMAQECPGGDPGAMKIRYLLWLRHGCPSEALYGDDGEMQCSSCCADFKRMDAGILEEALAAGGRRQAEKGLLADLLR